MFAHTSPSCRDLSTGPPRHVAPPLRSALGRVADRVGAPYNPLRSGGKMTRARTCAATRPNSFNPFETRIIFSIFREATMISRAYGSRQIENFLSLSPVDTRLFIFDLILVPFPFGVFSFFFLFFFLFGWRSFPLSATLQYTVFYYTTLCGTAMRIILYNIYCNILYWFYCTFYFYILRCASKFYLHSSTMDFSFSFRVI